MICNHLLHYPASHASNRIFRVFGVKNGVISLIIKPNHNNIKRNRRTITIFRTLLLVLFHGQPFPTGKHWVCSFCWWIARISELYSSLAQTI